MAINKYFSNTLLAEKIDLAQGELVGTSHINKYGFNDTVGGDWETIQAGGASFVYPNTATIATIVSDDTNDTAAGIGARTVSIQGLDENYNQLTETVTLNGTTSVTTTNTFIRVFRCRVETGGSNGGAEGTIAVTVDGQTVATLDPEYDNQTLQAAYTIPKGHRGYLIRMQITSTKDNKSALIGLFAKPPTADSVWSVKQICEVYRNNVVVDFPIPLEFTEKTDLEIRGKNNEAGNISISATFDLILVKK